MNEKSIIIRGAREHNLKNIHLEIPRDAMTVITGVSGSGKSSLAFDTLSAEGQRRYVESLSAYARQFLSLQNKPDVDAIEGLSPSISIEQKSTSKNPRSTVGTVTEIYDYLRLLYARIGRPHCYDCGRPIESQTVTQMTDTLMALPERSRILLLAPIVQGRKGEYRKELSELQGKGFTRVMVDGEMYGMEEVPTLNKNIKHTIEVVVDRLIIKPGLETRLADSLETALNLTDVSRQGRRSGGGGTVKVQVLPRYTLDQPEEMLFSERHACIHCNISYPAIEPRLFSFNNPFGACPECGGLGTEEFFDPDLIIPNPTLSIRNGAIAPWAKSSSRMAQETLRSLADHYDFNTATPWQKLPEKLRKILLFGSGREKINFRYRGFRKRFNGLRSWEGLVNNLQRRYLETDSDLVREDLGQYRNTSPCPHCKGQRLRREALHIMVGDKSIAQVTALSLRQSVTFFQQLDLTEMEQTIAERILKEVNDRLNFLVAVGLDYLSLHRTAATLSGGESQRIRLANQIGSGLVGVLYILDEPSIGLHQRDNQRLLDALLRLRDLGNTVVVVEHDEDAMRAADCLVDMGPGPGEHGGEVVAVGPPDEIISHEDSLTGAYLAGRKKIAIPKERRTPRLKQTDGDKKPAKPSKSAKKRASTERIRAEGGKKAAKVGLDPDIHQCITLHGVETHNLKGVDVTIPLGMLTTITGVSGSGKSSLILDTLHPALAQRLHSSRIPGGKCRQITGLDHLDKVIHINQAPIGRTPRSNPATYTGLFTPVRDILAMVPEARARGYKSGRFSFNVKGGRCEACAGEGTIKIAMHFLPDVHVVCDACQGQRYNRETLEIHYKGRNIADILHMTVEDAAEFFQPLPAIHGKLQTLLDVGLGYIRLGQAATTLSGGEAQRIKIARELSKRATGQTLYILDEPTTGLHFEDISKLLDVLHRLVDAGNSVVVIEHNLDIIKAADWIIDLGPEGGDRGGEVVATGTPEQISTIKKSWTGQFLKPLLKKR